MEQVEQEEDRKQEQQDKEMMALHTPPKLMYWLGYYLKRPYCWKKWKPGPKKDRMRLNRVRCKDSYYNAVLDIPEIYEKIMQYLDHDDPADAIHFARALETLGAETNLEGLYLKKKKEQYGYTERVSIGLMRKKLLKGYHCRLCGVRSHLLDPSDKKKKNNTITTVPMCWKCMNTKYKLVNRNKAIAIMLKYNACMPMDQILSILGKPVGVCCKISAHDHLPSVKYSHQWYYVRNDVVKARENWIKRQKEEALLEPKEDTMDL